MRLLPRCNPIGLHLLEMMLAVDPAKRIPVEQALSHPYFQTFHNEVTEPICLQPFTFDFERLATSPEMFRGLVWEEMLAFHPHLGAS